MDPTIQFYNHPFLMEIIEYCSLFLGLAYVILIAKKLMLAWPCAILGSICGIYLCLNSQLYLESFLSLFYLVMGIWGWVSWSMSKRKILNSNREGIHPIRWKLKWHIANLAISGFVTLILGYYFDVYTDQSRPYLDSFTTVFSLAATFMVTQKVLENWIYWIIIDFTTIELYRSNGLYKLAFLMGVYTLLAFYGYFQWKREYDLMKNDPIQVTNDELLDQL